MICSPTTQSRVDFLPFLSFFCCQGFQFFIFFACSDDSHFLIKFSFPCFKRCWCNRCSTYFSFLFLFGKRWWIAISLPVRRKNFSTSRAKRSFSVSSFRRLSALVRKSCDSCSRRWDTSVNVIAIPVLSLPCGINGYLYDSFSAVRC